MKNTVIVKEAHTQETWGTYNSIEEAKNAWNISKDDYIEEKDGITTIYLTD